MSSGESVKVAVRVRPFNSREKSMNATLVIAMNGAATTISRPASDSHGGAEDKTFTFDYSFWSHDGFHADDTGLLVPDGDKYADQKLVFNTMGRDVLNNAYQGYNCSLFAYGQTGSGKSYSMVGYGVNKGIVPITCENIFDKIGSETDDKKEYHVALSMLEIYNEAVRDLLDNNPAPKGGLQVRQHPKLGVQVVGLKEIAVQSYEEIEKRIDEGTKNRTIASTNMNATSSRAHTVVAISFTQVEKDAKGPGKNREVTSKINLVDLAGSERAESTGATGDRLKEGAAINLSLTMLGNVISALAEKSNNPTKKILVPYRDSKLTMILSDALGGNSKTIMIAALSPADVNYEETLSTLRYADRAKQIKNKAIVNVDPTEQLISKLKEENSKLLKQLEAFTKGGNFDLSLLEGGAPKGPISAEEKEKLKAELQAQLKNELEANKTILEEESKSWQKKYEEANQLFREADNQKSKENEKLSTVPHLVNINEDPSLSGMVRWFIEGENVTVGRKDASPPPNITLAGLSISKQHAVLGNKGGKITITALNGSKVMLNGENLGPEVHDLHHNDRVLFGGNNLFVFVNPKQKLAENLPDSAVTWEEAQEEIAMVQGFAVQRTDLSKLSQAEREQALLTDEIVKLVPLVAESNSIAEDLGKDVAFEVKMLNRAQGDKFKTEVVVVMSHPSTGAMWYWDSKKFLNRHYLFREVFYKFQTGEDISKMKKEEDPFWEPNAAIELGFASVYLQPLAFGLEFDDPVAIRDFQGKDQGLLQVKIYPCDAKGAQDTELYVEESKELLGKPLNLKIEIPFARGIDPRFKSVQVKFEFFGESFATETITKGTQNPEFKFNSIIKWPNVDNSRVKYLEEGLVRFQVFGEQSDTKPPAGVTVGARSSSKKKEVPGSNTTPMFSSRAAKDGALKSRNMVDKLEKEKVSLNSENLVVALEGAQRTAQMRINRMLARNTAALKLIDDLVKDKKLSPEGAKQLRDVLAPGGISKFKAIAHLVGQQAVHRRKSLAQPGGHSPENCAQQ